MADKLVWHSLREDDRKNLCCSFICVMMAVMKHLQKSRKKWHPVSGNIPGCRARFSLGLSRKIDSHCASSVRMEQTLPLNSQFMKMMFLYIQELYQDDEGETPVQSPLPCLTTQRYCGKTGSAGKVIGFLILAAAVVAVVYFMQT